MNRIVTAAVLRQLAMKIVENASGCADDEPFCVNLDKLLNEVERDREEA